MQEIIHSISNYGSFWYFNLYVIVLGLIFVPFICNSVWQYVYMHDFKTFIKNIKIYVTQFY